MPPLSFNSRELFELYARREFEALTERCLEFLRRFSDKVYPRPDAGTLHCFHAFITEFLTLFSQPDFVPSPKHAEAFIRANAAISNLAAMSPLQTTDAFLELVKSQPNNLIKVLTLYSARNKIQLDRRKFFDLDAEMASLWYLVYAGIHAGGLASAEVCENLRQHFAFQDDRMNVTLKITNSYFGSTYIDGVCDRPVKEAFNRLLQRQAAGQHIVNRPDPKKIAVISRFWWPGHPVYRNYAAYVRTLTDYHVTLFHIPVDGKPVDRSMFADVKQLSARGSQLDISSLADNDFSLIYFADVGMSPESIRLANLRIAPVQVASLGHSVSTWGAKIDYFLSGAEVEVADHPQRNYSERLVLLPGLGVVHETPQYQPSGRKRAPDNQFVINCPWSSPKINCRMVHALRQLVQRSPKPLRFRFLVGSTLHRNGDLLPLARQLDAELAPAVVEILPGAGYEPYMALLEEGDLSLESFHFGGCNTVADSLHVGKPIVTWEGDKWYNRIGSQMLRRVGLADLIATNETEYVEIILRLIADDAHRAAVVSRVAQSDLQSTLFNHAEARSFPTAIAYLIEHHPRLQAEGSREPIRIG